MPLKFSSELDFTSFREFAEKNAKYAYMQALTATHDDNKSERLAAKSLFLVLKNKKHFDADDNDINEKTAIDLTLRPLLSRKERDMLDNAPDANQILDEFLEDDDNSKEHFRIYPPSEESERKIIIKACAKADSITPKYAPMYTGTKSGIVLIIVLIFICAAIYFIWNDPADLLSDKSPAYSSSGSAVPVPSNGSLIDVEFKAEESALDCVPVRVYISGPDRSLVSSVTYSPEYSSSVSSAYQCGDEYWVMMVNSENYYKVNIKGSGGLDVVRHFRIGSEIPYSPIVTVVENTHNDNSNVIRVDVKTCDGSSYVSSADIADILKAPDGTYSISAPVGIDSTFYFVDGSGNQTGMIVTSYGQAIVSPSLDIAEISLGHDSSKTVELNQILPTDRTYSISAVSDSKDITVNIDSENVMTVNTSNGFVGIGNINLSVNDSYGLTTDTSIPVIVLNSAPYYADPSQLYSTVLHTPSNSGYLFGTLNATDEQGDHLTYTLTGQTDCNVTLSPNGSFMLFIDENYRGHSASFDFTVSDGSLTSVPYRYTISLHNNIIQSESYSQKFVCYAGENGWYTLNLPSIDSDGDILNWNVTTTLSDDGRTPEGNYISYGDGLSKVLIRVNPELNKKFSETITLTCSDGWLSSDTITVKCSFVKNEPPKAGKENRASIPVSESTGTFILDVKDDCEFDKSVIKEVISCSGGTVVDNIGWSMLQFTVNFDPAADPTQPVVAVFLVEDVATKETIEVRYTINRIAE